MHSGVAALVLEGLNSDKVRGQIMWIVTTFHNIQAAPGLYCQLLSSSMRLSLNPYQWATNRHICCLINWMHVFHSVKKYLYLWTNWGWAQKVTSFLINCVRMYYYFINQFFICRSVEQTFLVFSQSPNAKVYRRLFDWSFCNVIGCCLSQLSD